jgi:BASS family bile acid:Na+ symporter
MLPGALALIMFSMGLALTLNDFRQIFRHPKEVTVGLIAQMFFLPVLAFLLAWVAPISEAMKVGIILVAICPGGATSNLINYLLNGNLALCVSLTSLNAFLTQFSIPLLLNLAIFSFLGGEASVNLPFWDAVLEIFLVTLLPVAIGVWFQGQWNAFAQKLRKPLKYLMPLLLGIAMVGAAFFEKKNVPAVDFMEYLPVIPWLLTLNFGAMIGSYWFTGRLGFPVKTAMTIAVEVGLQNTGMAILLATGSALRDSPEIAVPASIYALFSFFTTGGWAWWIATQNKLLKI